METSAKDIAAPTIEYRTEDKSEWGAGPWQDEPDKRQWTDEATGLPCLMVRGPVGALCGYVGVLPDHPAYGLNYDHWRYGEDGEQAELTPVEAAINALEAHGGLTFAHGCGHGDDPSTGICHVPAPGQPDHVWWFGFDCAHAGDYAPGVDHRRTGYIGSPTGWGGVIAYRDQAYVEGEVRSLAAQLHALPSRLDLTPRASDRATDEPLTP